MPYDENGVWYDEPTPPVVNLPNVGSDIETKLSDNYTQAQDKIGLLNTTPTPDTNYVGPTQDQKTAAGATVKSGTDYMKDDYTVAGQLSKLLSSDSQYMKQVDAKSKLQANQLGMLSSDRYIGAATGAAIREGLPIATADAQTASKFGLQQQTAENTMATTSMEGLVSGQLKSQEYALQNHSKKIGATLDSYIKMADVGAEGELTNLKGQWDFAIKDSMARLENQLNTSFMANEYSQQTKENTRQQAASQIENTTIAIENLLKDPDILQLGPGEVATLINNQISLMRSGIELTYNLAGLNVDSYISDILDNYQDAYQWEEVDTRNDEETTP